MASIGGYTNEFADSPPPNKYECPICTLVSREPHQANCCGQIYCKSCLEELKDRGKFTCPTCRHDLKNNYFYDKRTDLEIKSFQVYCSNRSESGLDGCKWKGAIKDIDDHLLKCSYQMQSCEYSLIGCMEKMTINQQETHNKMSMKHHIDLALKEITSLSKKVSFLEENHRNPSVQYIQMSKFSRLKASDSPWNSPGFYVLPGSYKMCMRIFANGYGNGNGSHVTVFTCFMPGDHDDKLKWPFEGVVTVNLLNQLDDKNHENDITKFDDTVPLKYRERVVGKEHGLGWGTPKFIAHSSLDFSSASNCQYLKDDCLYFRICVKAN